jgi:D-alanine-D-alanine ligase
VPPRKISVLVLYNTPKVGWGLTPRVNAIDTKETRGLRTHSTEVPAFAESEAGVLAEVEAVRRALDKLRIGYRVVGVREFEELPGVLSASDEPVIFNLIEGFWTDPSRAMLVPTVIRSFGKACTGNDTPGQLLSLDKWQSKILLTAAGIPTPKGLLVPPGESIPTRDLFEGPYIVKPVRADGSEGIDNSNLVAGRGPALRRIVRRLHDQLGQPVLIEQYIEGRELNISVLSRRGELEVLTPAEIDFSDFEAGRPRILGYEAKWLEDSFEYKHTPRIIPAPLPKRVTERIRALAAASCRALLCDAYCRVDFRLDKSNQPYVLEVNANPDISLDAGLAAAIEVAGVSYPAFVKLEIENALARSSQLSVHSSQSKPASRQLTTDNRQPTTLNIRWCGPEDRQVVLSFLAETGFFRPDEIDIARELIDSGIAEGPKGHYQSYVARVNDQTVGWVCWGPTPCTLGTFDIYWIGVASNMQGRGIGRALTNFAEQSIAERGGRLYVVETSSRETYTPTHRFYEALGYWEASRIPDFYGPGDDRVIFLKAAPDATTRR